MAKQEQFRTPVGIARYPYLTKADLVGKYADGKYKSKLVVSKKDAKTFMDSMKAIAKANNVKQLPYAEDPDNDENIIISVKSKRKPTVYDAKKNPVPPEVEISGGSKLRFGGIIYVYDKGLSLQLEQVQVIDLVSRSSEPMFDEIEGSFDASELSDEPTSGEDDSDDEMDL